MTNNNTIKDVRQIKIDVLKEMETLGIILGIQIPGNKPIKDIVSYGIAWRDERFVFEITATNQETIDSLNLPSTIKDIPIVTRIGDYQER